jgi:hypothetical protein
LIEKDLPDRSFVCPAGLLRLSKKSIKIKYLRKPCEKHQKTLRKTPEKFGKKNIVIFWRINSSSIFSLNLTGYRQLKEV